MMKKIILWLVVFLAGFQFLSAQNATITGVVTLKEDGSPAIGASVMEKGTTNGVITDVDGNYTITVHVGATLEFKYLGTATQSRKIVKSDRFDIVLVPDNTVIDEVVVTAMGIKAEKKRLNFAVQSINADDLNDKKATNFVDALQGKISGISVTSSGGSPNAGTQVIIRGISSINPGQPNQPLFVLDGVRISANGSSAADFNPNDIENVTVLKGAAASALYGQDAANGVIMITTKKAQAGKLVATANMSWESDVPTRVPQLQTSYAPGAQGFYVDKAMGGWGPLLNPGEKTYDNVNNFLGNGFYQKYDFSLVGGSEQFQAYASANYSRNEGIIPNDYLNKLGVLLKGTYQPFKQLSITISANIMNNTFRTAGDAMSSVYNWPINDDITNYQLINGFPRFLYYNDAVKYSSPVSPLFSRYNDNGVNRKQRDILSGTVEWKPIKNLNITGRISYDASNNSYDGYQVPRWDKSLVLPNLTPPATLPDNATAAQQEQYDKDLATYNTLLNQYRTTPYLTVGDIGSMSPSLLGYYNASMSNSRMLDATFLATYSLKLPKEFSVDFLVGSELRTEDGFSISNQGYDFMIPGTYSLLNTNLSDMVPGDVQRTQKRGYGYFGEIRGDYKGIASLSVTSRWDWSSTIYSSYTQLKPYYYPSFTGGLLFSELFHLSNDVFSYGKLRGNLAKIGKDANQRYLYDRRYKQFITYPDNGFGIDPTLSSAEKTLTPEMTSSWEIGADLRFFKNRTRLDMAYYSTQANNQIVTVRVTPATGYILQTRNEGNVRNQGVEFTLEQDIIKNKDFLWTAALNFGLNRGKVVSLPDQLPYIQGTQYGDIYSIAFVGKSTTSISGIEYLRTDDGKIICDANGYPKIGTNKMAYLGNREPKFRSGLTNTLNYKAWSLSFLFDGRLGGDIMNVTGRGLISNGQSKMLQNYRGRQVVVDGVVQQADGSYTQNTTPITLDYKTINDYFYSVSSNFIEDGSYIRLNYLALGYAIPQKISGKLGLTGLRCSFTANNLFMLTRYTGSDPICNANTEEMGTGSAGIDNYPVPSVTSYNFSITATF